MYKLVAIDLDGTLLNKNKEISALNKDAILYLKENGVKVILASGRIFRGIRIYSRELDLREPVIACNGALIKDSITGEVMFGEYMDKHDVLKIIKKLKERHIYFHIYVDDVIYTEKIAFTTLIYEKQNEKLSDENKILIEVVDDIIQKIEDIQGNISKVIVISNQSELLDDVKRDIENIVFDLDVDIVSSDKNNFEIVKKGVEKGRTLKILADLYNIDQNEIIAIGDNENDISMIRYASCGVAMNNATENLKNVARYITDDNDSSGVAKIIKKIFEF